MACVASRFDAQVEIEPFTVGVGSRFSAEVDTIEAGVGSRFGAHHQVRAGVASRFNAFGLRQAGVASRLMSKEVMFAQVLGRMDARETTMSVEAYLGWIDADASPRKLTDIPMLDGIYEIEIRSSKYFWQACRGRRVVTMIIAAGRSWTGLPAIQDLASSVALGVTTITWKVGEEQQGSFQFGLWYSPTSPVDTSEPPDQVVAHCPEIGDYQAARHQVTSEFVAVASIVGVELGKVSEVFLYWDTQALANPPNQLALE